MYRVELKATSADMAPEMFIWFLMYRVELKGSFPSMPVGWVFPCQVPNVPCGVESPCPEERGRHNLLFLMYRVELKVVVKYASRTIFACS